MTKPAHKINEGARFYEWVHFWGLSFQTKKTVICSIIIGFFSGCRNHPQSELVNSRTKTWGVQKRKVTTEACFVYLCGRQKEKRALLHSGALTLLSVPFEKKKKKPVPTLTSMQSHWGWSSLSNLLSRGKSKNKYLENNFQNVYFNLVISQIKLHNPHDFHVIQWLCGFFSPFSMKCLFLFAE